jgi:hypothetical protein
MKRLKIVSIFVLIIFTIVACVGLSGLDPQNLRMPHARARFINVTYTMAFADYQRFAVLENLKPEAITLLKAKRTIMVNLNLPIAIFNGHAETGTITDALFNELLHKLTEMETGWYTEQSMGAATDTALRLLIYKAGLKEETITEQTIMGDPIFMGILIELIRTGIHAYRALMSQRDLDAAQMEQAWRTSYDDFKALNVLDLVTIK